jgi:hypothetical protein
MNRCLRCFGWAVVAAFFFANGCGSPTSTGSLQPGTEVRLIGEQGTFGKIQTAEGEVGYVPLGLLKQRNTAKVSDAVHSHTLVREVDLQEAVPADATPPSPRKRSEIDREQHNIRSMRFSSARRRPKR